MSTPPLFTRKEKEKVLYENYQNQLEFVHFGGPMRQRINLQLISKVIYELMVKSFTPTGTRAGEHLQKSKL